jgi:sulfoxide reductase heme-binding subunit YedZ
MVLTEARPAAATTARRLPRDWRVRFVAKPLVFAACLAPFAWLVWLGASGGLGANPIEAAVRYCGDWALRFLLIALAVTPLKAVTGWAAVMRFRRMLGLFAFFYVVLHVAGYVGLDQFFAWKAIWADVVKRRYITFGMLAFVLLVPLAATSTKGMIKRLGAVRWQRLHRLVYPAAILAVVHFFMMVKADVREPAIYAAVLAVLLGARLALRRSPRVGRGSRREGLSGRPRPAVSG